MISHTIGAVLAGGSSRRMGSDKASLTIGGETFVERLHSTLSEVFSQVVVCGGSVVPSNGVLIADHVPGGGPLGGLLSAFNASKGRSVFVIAVDMPLVSAESIRSIAHPMVSGDAARIASVDGNDQPLVGVYGPEVKPIVENHLDNDRRSAFGVLVDVALVERVDIRPEEALNINTREVYEALVRDLGPLSPS